jgi:hypothetical protein
VAARTRVIGRHEAASHGRIDPNDLEEIPGDERDRHPAAVDMKSDAGHGGIGVCEDLRVGSHRLEERTRQQRAIAAGRRPLDRVHLADIGHLVDAEDECIENGEQHRHHAKSDGHRDDDGECGERGLGEGAQRVLDVANGVVDDRGAALVAAAIGGQRRRSEARLRAFACLRRRHAFIDQLSGFALDVEGELLLELLLDAVGPEQHTQPQFEVVERHASFITRPMALAMRSHSRASTAS